jgi:hypothetical protein
MSNVSEGHGEPVIEALGKNRVIPIRFDKVKEGVSESSFLGCGTPLGRDELRPVEWTLWHETLQTEKEPAEADSFPAVVRP